MRKALSDLARNVRPLVSAVASNLKPSAATFAPPPNKTILDHPALDVFATELKTKLEIDDKISTKSYIGIPDAETLDPDLLGVALFAKNLYESFSATDQKYFSDNYEAAIERLEYAPTTRSPKFDSTPFSSWQKRSFATSTRDRGALEDMTMEDMEKEISQIKSDKTLSGEAREAKYETFIYSLYLMQIKIKELKNDVFHLRGARAETVGAYYQSYLEAESKLLEDSETKEFSRLCEDKVKLFFVEMPKGVAGIAKMGEKVVGRMFIGNENAHNLHLSIFAPAKDEYLEEKGIKTSGDMLLWQMTSDYGEYLKQSGKEDSLEKTIQTSCIAGYHGTIVAGAGNYADKLCKEEDNSLRRFFQLKYFISAAEDFAKGILATKTKDTPSEEVSSPKIDVKDGIATPWR